MQPWVVVLITVVALALLVILTGSLGQLGIGTVTQGLSQPTQVIQPTQEAQPTRQAPYAPQKIKIEIGKVLSWDGDVADIPLMLTGQPLHIEFVIRFPRNLVQVSQVESSANWKTWIERSNATGEIFVRAEPLRITAGSLQLLTLRFHRLERATAALTIPRETIKARFPLEVPYEVEVISGSIGPFVLSQVQ